MSNCIWSGKVVHINSISLDRDLLKKFQKFVTWLKICFHFTCNFSSINHKKYDIIVFLKKQFYFFFQVETYKYTVPEYTKIQYTIQFFHSNLTIRSLYIWRRTFSTIFSHSWLNFESLIGPSSGPGVTILTN